MDVKSARKIIKKVEKDYDAMAEGWDKSRDLPRPYQIKNAAGVKRGNKVLDIGCGNAVLYDTLAKKSIEYTGVDISGKMLEMAKKRIGRNKRKLPVRFIKGSIIGLPFKDNQFDWVLALAVLHHLPSRELQEKAVQEIYRVLKPKGKTIVSVWNLHSDYAEEKFKIKEQFKKKPDGWAQNDLKIPWRAAPGKTIQRYLYSFDKKELFGLFKKAGFKRVAVEHRDPAGRRIKSLKKGHNLAVTAQK